MTVLMLNATFEPLTTVSWHRAIVLLLEGEADVVEEDVDNPVRSPSVAFPMPTVIRLRSMRNIPYRARIPLNRRAVLARDNGRCAYCKGRADTVDHVIPRSRGGRHEWANAVAACRRCNAAKDDRLLSELGAKWELDFVPYMPSGAQWLVLSLNSKINPSWMPYLGVEPDPAMV